MKFDFATQQIGDYQVVTPVYEGPLDLLLQLIEGAELDITKLSLAKVTDQYLGHLNNIPSLAPQEVSAFLVIAAKLLQIKSEALLPTPPKREEGEEDLGEALARQLRAYKRYKQIAAMLENRQNSGLRSYLRLASPPKIPEKVEFGDFTLSDLASMAEKTFSQSDDRQDLGTVVAAPKVTVREMVDRIIQALKEHTQTTFNRILGSGRSRLEVVVTFIAMLELIKRQFVRAKQERLFSDIILEADQGWEQDTDFELEFGE